MFAQLLITAVLVAAVAEGMSRWLLRKSLWSLTQEAFSDALGPEPTPDAGARLEALVKERREALSEARRRARLANRAATVTDDLSSSTGELVEAEERLAEAERRLEAELRSETRGLD